MPERGVLICGSEAISPVSMSIWPRMNVVRRTLGLDADIAEDIRRMQNFERTREAIPLDEVKAWVESWGTPNELPQPKPRKITW